MAGRHSKTRRNPSISAWCMGILVDTSCKALVMPQTVGVITTAVEGVLCCTTNVDSPSWSSMSIWWHLEPPCLIYNAPCTGSHKWISAGKIGLHCTAYARAGNERAMPLRLALARMSQHLQCNMLHHCKHDETTPRPSTRSCYKHRTNSYRATSRLGRDVTCTFLSHTTLLGQLCLILL